MKILKEQTNPSTSISGTCVFNYFVKKYPNNQKTPKTAENDWNLVKGQLHRLYNNGQIIVFNPNGEYSIREGYGRGKINKIIDGTKGKWVCDGNSDYFIEYDNGNFLSTKMGQKFDITKDEDKIAIDIIKQKLKLNDISNQTKPNLEKLSTKLDEYKEDIKNVDWWNSLESIWTAVKNKVKETLDNLSTTSTSTGTSGTSGRSTQRKRGTPLNPEDYEGIEFKFKYPNDKNYIYGVKGGDWYAKNVNNQKVFNISKDGFQPSVDRLNATFPDAFKSGNNKEPEKETNINTTKPNVQVRPDENTFTKMKQDADKLPKDIGFKPKYPTTPKDSIDGGQKVLNKQEEPTIYNIDSNKEEL